MRGPCVRRRRFRFVLVLGGNHAHRTLGLGSRRRSGRMGRGGDFSETSDELYFGRIDALLDDRRLPDLRAVPLHTEAVLRLLDARHRLRTAQRVSEQSGRVGTIRGDEEGRQGIGRGAAGLALSCNCRDCGAVSATRNTHSPSGRRCRVRSHLRGLALSMNAALGLAALAQTPADPLRACLASAEQQWKRGHSGPAILQLTACAREFPRSPSPHLALGRLLKNQGELMKAAAEFQTAARLDPRSPLAAGELGLARMMSKDYAGALEALRGAAKLAPRDASILFSLFQCELELKQFDASAEKVQAIVHLSPAVPEMFNRLAAEQVRAGDYRHAVSNLERAATLDQADPLTRYNLVLALFKAGETARALAAAEPLRTPESAEVENLLGDIFEKLERPLDAVPRLPESGRTRPSQRGLSLR